MIWKRVRYEGDEFWTYWAGPYRIDPEVAWSTRSFHPLASRYRVYFAPEGQQYGGTEIGMTSTVREAKAKAEAHAAATAAVDNKPSL